MKKELLNRLIKVALNSGVWSHKEERDIRLFLESEANIIIGTKAEENIDLKKEQKEGAREAARIMVNIKTFPDWNKTKQGGPFWQYVYDRLLEYNK